MSRQATGDVVVIAIDAPSIEKIGIWPWPRRLHADLLRRLQAADVRDIVFDVDFSAPSDPATDRVFAEALQSAGGSVVLPAFKQPGAKGGDETAIHINRPLKQFGDHAWTAVVNVAVEPDGLVRRYPFGEKLDGQFLPSMAAVLAGQHAAKREPFLIDFSIRVASIPQSVLHRCAARRRCDAGQARTTRRSSSAAPRSNSAIASAFRTAASFPDRCCRRWQPNRSCRTAR